MILELCKAQGCGAVETLYERAGFKPEMKDATISVLRRLQEDASDRRVWGLLSMGSIVLLAENAYDSLRYVQFWAGSRDDYQISYALPEECPWHTLTAETDNEDAAVAMILEAMDLSGGWSAAPRHAVIPKVALPDPSEILQQKPPWPVLGGPVQIVEFLKQVQFPNPVQISTGEFEVTVTQGDSAFLKIYSYETMHCWVPPKEAPWPGSIYEGSYRNEDQALTLIRAAIEKWPREESQAQI